MAFVFLNFCDRTIGKLVKSYLLSLLVLQVNNCSVLYATVKGLHQLQELVTVSISIFLNVFDPQSLFVYVKGL